MARGDLSSQELLPSKDQRGARTPLRCPICDSPVTNVHIRDLGGVSGDILWQVHAGECTNHGWFQAEIVSRPPREIFAVDRPFGVARRVDIDGDEVFAFATVWNDVSTETKRSKVDPFDPRYWHARRTAYRIT